MPPVATAPPEVTGDTLETIAELDAATMVPSSVGADDTTEIEATPVTRDYLIEMVIHETGTIRRRAEAFVGWLENAVREAREHGRVYHLGDHDIDAMHDLLEIVLKPNDDKPAAGSAHATANALLIQPGEQTIIHTSRGPARDCTVEVVLA